MLEAFNERTRARVLASRWGLARRARGYARTGMCMLYIRTYVLPTCVTLYSYIRTTSTDGGRTRTRSPRAAPNLRLKDSTLNLQFGFKFPLVKSKGFIRDQRALTRVPNPENRGFVRAASGFVEDSERAPLPCSVNPRHWLRASGITSAEECLQSCKSLTF